MKPTVEQALLFKRLREHDWFGVPGHVIKECLEATGWKEDAAKEYLDRNFIPPHPGFWCPRWSYLGNQRAEGDEDFGGPGIRWYLVMLWKDEDGRQMVVPLDENLEPTNKTGRKMIEMRTIHADGSFGEWEQMEGDTTGTEGHAYLTFTAAAEALTAHPDKYGSVYLQCPDKQRLKKEVAVAA